MPVQHPATNGVMVAGHAKLCGPDLKRNYLRTTNHLKIIIIIFIDTSLSSRDHKLSTIDTDYGKMPQIEKKITRGKFESINAMHTAIEYTSLN